MYCEALIHSVILGKSVDKNLLVHVLTAATV